MWSNEIPKVIRIHSLGMMNTSNFKVINPIGGLKSGGTQTVYIASNRGWEQGTEYIRYIWYTMIKNKSLSSHSIFTSIYKTNYELLWNKKSTMKCIIIWLSGWCGMQKGCFKMIEKNRLCLLNAKEHCGFIVLLNINIITPGTLIHI